MSDERLAEAIAKCERAWRDRWAEETPETPRRKLHYVVQFDCTYETWQSVMAALKGFPLSNKHYRQEEVSRLERR